MSLNRDPQPPPRVGNFRQKNYFVEDKIDGTIGLFLQNSGCSAEQKTLGIPFRTITDRRKMLGILYPRGTKLEANTRKKDEVDALFLYYLMILTFRGLQLQRDVVYLGVPRAPSYVSPNSGGGRLLRALSQ